MSVKRVSACGKDRIGGRRNNRGKLVQQPLLRPQPLRFQHWSQFAPSSTDTTASRPRVDALGEVGLTRRFPRELSRLVQPTSHTGKYALQDCSPVCSRENIRLRNQGKDDNSSQWSGPNESDVSCFNDPLLYVPYCFRSVRH